MILEVTLDEARLIYKNMRSMFVMPDEQKAVYFFISRLGEEIELEENKLIHDNSQRKLDK